MDEWENKDMNDPELRMKQEELRREEMKRLKEAREARELDEVMGPVLGIIKKILQEEELPKMAAGFIRRYYVALVEEGFHPEDAIKLMVATAGQLKK
jgi:hypothetical protein